MITAGENANLLRSHLIDEPMFKEAVLPGSVSMTGTGWNCTGNTCTRNDGLPAGANYPAIIVTVNVLAHALPAVINQVSVAGGGSPATSGAQLTTIAGPSVSDVDLDNIVIVTDVQKLINQALGASPAGTGLNHDRPES